MTKALTRPKRSDAQPKPMKAPVVSMPAKPTTPAASPRSTPTDSM